MNMLSVIQPKSDQINADDMIGTNMTIVIEDVQIKGGQEQPVSIYFQGSDKAFRPCKSMSRVLVAGWGADAKKYVGRSLTLYRDPTVKWGGMEVGGIRISHMSHIDKPLVLALTATKGSRKMTTIQPLVTPKLVAGLDIDGARERLNDAGDLEALKVAWSAKDMRPFRDALQPDLDRRKAELSGEGRDTTDQGESHATDADALIAQFNAADDQASYDAAKKAFVVLSGSLSDDENEAVDAAGDEAAARVLG